ncbi:hypothetical protein C8J57DRAFT_1575466 [Mycena rebaudengoi]|nr:hypothetical protein C8J57DRAFT_1575466 [Mycena rebaudengoi]
MSHGRRGGARAAAVPAMHTHMPHRSGVVSVSNDGRRATQNQDFSYTLDDDSLPAEHEEAPADGIAYKAPRNENSDAPMKTWVNHRQEYLDEMLRAEGRGDACNYDNCRRCGSPNPTFRCEGQLCHGPAMSCKVCIVASHAALPTHWVEEWNGVFFERRSLAEIGLVIQLGHPVGYGCPASLRAHQKFVVIDTTGVHIVAMQFCECDSRVAHWQQLMRGLVACDGA